MKRHQFLQRRYRHIGVEKGIITNKKIAAMITDTLSTSQNREERTNTKNFIVNNNSAACAAECKCAV
jgi:hypothetical protein